MKHFIFISLTLVVLLASCQTQTQQPTLAPAPTTAPPTATPTSAVTATPLFAPGEKLASDIKELVGTWKGIVDGIPGFMIISDDGTIKLTKNADGTGGNSHRAQFEGDILKIHQDVSLHNCDQIGQYQVRIQQDASKTVSMAFTLIGEDPCEPRVHDLVIDTPRWTLP